MINTLGSIAVFKRQAVLAIVLLGSLVSADVKAQSWSQVGMLNCNLAPSVGMIIFGQQRMSCRFNPNATLPPQNYTGVLTTVGVDIGATAGGEFGWAVFSQTTGPAFGGLAGTYAGASAEVTVAIGGGVNVLIGGSGRSVALQPLSGQATTGLNVQGGISSLELTVAP